MQTTITTFLILTLVVPVIAAGDQSEQSSIPDSECAQQIEHVIVIVVDSLSSQQFEKQLALGQLPNLKKEFVDRGLWVRNCVASFPPTSFSSHASIFTGTLPYQHGVVSLRWFDRESGQNRSYAGIGAMLLNRDYLNGLGTLHHSFIGERNTAIGQVVNAGASHVVPPLIPNDGVRMRILRRQFRGKKPPALATIWLTELDPVAHKYGPHSPQAERHLQGIDKTIGFLMNDLKQRGIYDKTVCAFLADHGQTDCQYLESLPTLLKQSGFDVLDILYYTIRDEFLFRGYDAIAWGCGVGVYFVYLPHRTQDSRRFDWKQRPSLEMLRSYPIKGKQIDLIQLLVEKDSIGLVVVREQEQAVRVFGKEGSCRIRWIHDDLIPTMTRADFAIEIVDGEDPLGLAKHEQASPLMDGAFHPASQWLIATAESEMPDAPVQLAQAMLSQRAADLLVLAAPGWELETSWHKGRHSGYSQLEVMVPLLISGAGVPHCQVPFARTVDLYPTILKLTDRKTRNYPVDGFVLEPIRGKLSHETIP